MSALLDQLLTRAQRESCAKYDAHPSLHDWSDRQRFSELVATHRPGFCAGTEVPTEAAHVCTELGADQIRAESEADPWLWKLIPAAIAAGAILTAWFEVAP